MADFGFDGLNQSEDIFNSRENDVMIQQSFVKLETKKEESIKEE